MNSPPPPETPVRRYSRHPENNNTLIKGIIVAITALIAAVAAIRACPDENKIPTTPEETQKSAEGKTATLRDEPKSDGFNRKKLHLAKATEKGNTEAAALIYDAIKETCDEEYIAFHVETDAKRIQCQDLSDVNPRSECETDLFSSAIVGCKAVLQSLEQWRLCYTTAFEKHKFKCDGESEESPQKICLKQTGITVDQVWNDGEELKKACPRQEAENLGVDLDTVTELNKIAQTERLKKQRDKFLAGDKTPSQDDIEEYKSTINNIFADDVLKDFGSIDTFGYNYIYDVTESWRAYGEQFEEAALQLEERWETGRFYYIAAEEVGSGTTYHTD